MKKLTHPKHGRPLDHAHMPVTSSPVEGGVVMVNASLPADHPAQVVYREQSPDEKKQAKQDRKNSATFTKASSMVFLRITRDSMLQLTDHYGDNGPWGRWRQQLRDLPSIADPEDPEYPYPPEAVSVLWQHSHLWPDLDWGRFSG